MHGWRLLPGKISLPFKTRKNIKIADPVLTMNRYFTKKVKMPVRKKDLEAFLASHHGWVPETRWSLLCLLLFLYYM